MVDQPCMCAALARSTHQSALSYRHQMLQCIPLAGAVHTCARNRASMARSRAATRSTSVPCAAPREWGRCKQARSFTHSWGNKARGGTPQPHQHSGPVSHAACAFHSKQEGSGASSVLGGERTLSMQEGQHLPSPYVLSSAVQPSQLLISFVGGFG